MYLKCNIILIRLCKDISKIFTSLITVIDIPGERAKMILLYYEVITIILYYIER